MFTSMLIVVAAAVAAFFVGFAWYSIFGERLSKLSTTYAQQQDVSFRDVALEFLRCLLIATALAVLTAWTGVTHLAMGATLGLIVWVGFVVPILAGSVVHEHYPWQLAAIHLGDWLIKLVVCGLIVAWWR
jgi:Protein of unknown function (DUF1761)